MWFRFEDLKIATFDRDHATQVGVRAQRLDAAMLVLLAICVVVCLSTVGTVLTVGVAEIPVGAVEPERGHMHAQSEVYYFLSGTGHVVVNGSRRDVHTGDAVFIPGNSEHVAVNTGTEPLRLLYFFAADSFGHH